MTAAADTEVTCQARLSERLLGPAWGHAGHQSPPHPPWGLRFTWSGLRLGQLPFWGAELRTATVRRVHSASATEWALSVEEREAWR